ncbi:hypothetical protein K239x_19510 [Planctomycetes bacterium K23_9]|uniref:Uncharacterized protein n=1 Tax=Stieleria marina TaxID=1930275 RepID=A0A517NS83_9BACT|nr:hypothetical protein K239x_19510 [Planctomycetes bacterium K23_9]
MFTAMVSPWPQADTNNPTQGELAEVSLLGSDAAESNRSTAESQSHECLCKSLTVNYLGQTRHSESRRFPAVQFVSPTTLDYALRPVGQPQK